jgi:hypothetical protein
MIKVKYQLVHANIATPRAPLEDPLMRDFVERIDEIDALAQGWPGFIAQPMLPDERLIFSEPILVNVSTWESVENLREFTYASKHAEFLKRRTDWFIQSDLPAYVLYWAPADQVPTEAEIKLRRDHLHWNGATPLAFTFDEPYTVDEMLAFTGREKENGAA